MRYIMDTIRMKYFTLVLSIFVMSCGSTTAVRGFDVSIIDSSSHWIMNNETSSQRLLKKQESIYFSEILHKCLWVETPDRKMSSKFTFELVRDNSDEFAFAELQFRKIYIIGGDSLLYSCELSAKEEEGLRAIQNNVFVNKIS